MQPYSAQSANGRHGEGPRRIVCDGEAEQDVREEGGTGDRRRCKSAEATQRGRRGRSQKRHRRPARQRDAATSGHGRCRRPEARVMRPASQRLPSSPSIQEMAENAGSMVSANVANRARSASPSVSGSPPALGLLFRMPPIAVLKISGRALGRFRPFPASGSANSAAIARRHMTMRPTGYHSTTGAPSLEAAVSVQQREIARNAAGSACVTV